MEDKLLCEKKQFSWLTSMSSLIMQFFRGYGAVTCEFTVPPAPVNCTLLAFVRCTLQGFVSFVLQGMPETLRDDSVPPLLS